MTELFDRITELNNTDDTEYEEDDFDGEGYQEDDTPEPETFGQFREMEGYPRQYMIYNPNTLRGPYQQNDPPQPHEFAFQRDRPNRSATVPPATIRHGHSRDIRPDISPTSNLQGAMSRLNAQIQASAPVTESSRLSRVTLRHGRTAADVLPIIESSLSSTDAIPNIPTEYLGPENDNGAAFFRTYQDRALIGVTSRGNGALTPDLNYAEIGHGRGTQGRNATRAHDLGHANELTPQQASVSRLSPALDPPQSGSSRANSDSEGEPETEERTPEDSTPIAPETNTKWTYREPVLTPPANLELHESLQSALGPESSRGRREQARALHDAQPDSRPRSVKRGIRNTLHAAENYATALLFGRNTSEARPETSGPGPGNSAHGHRTHR